MKTVEKIQSILKEKMITPAQMLRDIKLSSGLFSQWKSGKQDISQKSLDKIADYLGVTPEYLRRDELIEKAVNKFGFFWEAKDRENKKAESREKISSGTLSNEEIFENAVIIFKAHFSASLEADQFSLNHVDFKTYVSMLLNQKFWQNEYSSEVYSMLLSEFGKREGISEGRYYHKRNSANSELSEKIDFTSLNVLDSTKIHQIPVFKSISAGFGAYVSSDIIDYMPLFIKSDYEAQETICIKVQGNSMYPKIEDGDIIVVHKQDEVDSGSVAALIVGDEGFVKKLVYDKDHAEFISFNPEYPTKVFKGSEMRKIKVVGLVKKIVKNM